MLYVRICTYTKTPFTYIMYVCTYVDKNIRTSEYIQIYVCTYVFGTPTEIPVHNVLYTLKNLCVTRRAGSESETSQIIIIIMLLLLIRIVFCISFLLSNNVLVIF